VPVRVVPAADSVDAVEVRRIFMPPEVDMAVNAVGWPVVPVGRVAFIMLLTMVAAIALAI
jgi:hypothetical protein